jgi:hypothetical protein
MAFNFKPYKLHTLYQIQTSRLILNPDHIHNPFLVLKPSQLHSLAQLPLIAVVKVLLQIPAIEGKDPQSYLQIQKRTDPPKKEEQAYLRDILAMR